MADFTNEDRASAAARGMRAYAKSKYEPGAEDDKTIFGDMICDMLHLADLRGWDFDWMVATARSNHADEVAEERAEEEAED